MELCVHVYIYNRKLFYGATVTNIILFVIWTTIVLHDIWQELSSLNSSTSTNVLYPQQLPHQGPGSTHINTGC